MQATVQDQTLIPNGQSTPEANVNKRKRKIADITPAPSNQSAYQSNSNQLNGSVRVAASAQPAVNRAHSSQSQNNGGTKAIMTKEAQLRQQQYETLLDLYGDNYCQCQNQHCKGHLSNKFRTLMKTKKVSSTLLRELTQLITGSVQKHSAKLFRYFLKFLEDQELDKDLLDDLLQLFVVLFLKSEESVKVTVLQDLDFVFTLLKQQQTKIFVDRQFKQKIFFYSISQYQHCLTKMEAGKTAGTPEGYVCSNLYRNFKNEAVKSRQSEDANRFDDSRFTVDGCKTHGNCNAMDEAIDLDDEKALTQFLCFLATLKFRLYHVYETPEVSQTYKQKQCKVFLFIMFLFLDYGAPNLYYYPLRALTEFFSNQKTARELSKRLNAESLLAYKQHKEMLGVRVLDEFQKKISLETAKPSDKRTILGSSHNDQIFDDVQQKLRDVLRRLHGNENQSCFILCLKIVSQLIKRQMQEVQQSFIQGPGPNKQYRRTFQQETVTLYVNCLERVGENLSRLVESDKEVFFTEVKSLIKIIQWNQQRYIQEKKTRRQIAQLNKKLDLNIDIEMQSEDSEEELKEESKQPSSSRRGMSAASSFVRHGNAKLTKEEYAVYHGHRLSTGKSSRRQTIDAQDRIYPGLDVLMRLIPLSAIQQYPKLSLLVYDALSDVIQVFDNKYVSFFNQCLVHKIIEKKVNTSSTATQSQQDDGTQQQEADSQAKARKLKKQIRIDSSFTSSREQVLNFYLFDYRTKLDALASSKSKIAEQKDGNDRTEVITQQQKAKNKKEVDRLATKRKNFTKSEITAIVDLLISLCKYYQIGDKHALTLGCHLLPDFYNQAKNQHKSIITASMRSNEANAELLMVNFELRSKHYLNMISEQQKFLQAKISDVQSQLEDVLFGELFTTTYKEMIQPESQSQESMIDFTGGRLYSQGGGIGCMQIYTSQFLKVLTRIMHRGKEYLNVSTINEMIKNMLFSSELILVANTMPLFTLAQMFILNEQTNSEIDDQDFITKVFQLIQRNIQASRDQHTRTSHPLLFYYKMRNIISTYTSLLNYLLCKTLNRRRTDDSQKLFVVRKQRRCNFCGYHLDQPQQFTFSIKCQACSLKNSALILPTCFMCDRCTDKNADYLQVSSKISLSPSTRSSDDSQEPVGQNHISSLFTEAIWTSITASLRLLDEQIRNEKSRQTQGFFTNAYNTVKREGEEQEQNVASCLSKVEGSNQIHNHMIHYLVTRMLKVFHHLCEHGVTIHTDAVEAFRRIEAVKDDFGDAFSLLKDRIESVATQIQFQELQEQLIMNESLGASAAVDAHGSVDKTMTEENKV